MTRRLFGFALLATAYFALGKLGLLMAFVNASASAVWPSAGLALGAMLVWGYRIWPAIAAAAFLVNLTTSYSVGSWRTSHGSGSWGRSRGGGW